MDVDDHLSDMDLDNYSTTYLRELDLTLEASKATPEPASAVSKVLGTTELLERILLCLPFRSLVRSQGVNTTFLATIVQSVHLRRKLFLEPEAVKAPKPSSIFFSRVLPPLDGDHISIVPRIPFGTSYHDHKKNKVIIRFARNGGIAVSADDEAKRIGPSLECVRWQDTIPTQPPIDEWRLVITGIEGPLGTWPLALHDEPLTLGRIFELGMSAAQLEGCNHVKFVGRA